MNHDWLVMLFLGADDDLSPFGQNLLEEATRVGSSDRVKLVAELNPTVDAQTLRGSILRGRRELKQIGITDGSVSSIAGFIDDSKKQFKAKHRALILWDHGNGWQNVHVFNKVLEPKKKLFVKDLGGVLNQGRNIAVVGFDACLMAMIEIAFQLRGRAQFMVASQHLLPAERGWPYEALLRALTTNPGMDATELVTTMIDTFAGSYNGASDPVALSALRLTVDKIESAVNALDQLSGALLSAIDTSDARQADARDKIILARQHTQSFGNTDYIDIISFCEEIQERFSEDKQICSAVQNVKSAVAELVVRQTRSGAPSVARANGVSIYFPQTYPATPPPADKAAIGDPNERRGSTIAESYAQLDFARACRWSTFLKVMVEGIDVPKNNKVRPAISAVSASATDAHSNHKHEKATKRPHGAAAKHRRRPHRATKVS